MNFSELDNYVKSEGGLSRRLFLSYSAALSTLPWLGTAVPAIESKTTMNLIRLVWESPLEIRIHESMILWTKLAPKPLQLDSGMPAIGYTEVKWEVAKDESFQNIVSSGVTEARAELGFSVHVETSD